MIAFVNVYSMRYIVSLRCLFSIFCWSFLFLANTNNAWCDPFSDELQEANNKVDSIWHSEPEEIKAVTIQVLDKISGKVFRQKVTVDNDVTFETLKISVKRCFKNGEADPKEIYAYVVVKDNEKLQFSGWLFASSPAVNLFEHAIYDVRIEF